MARARAASRVQTRRGRLSGPLSIRRQASLIVGPSYTLFERIEESGIHTAAWSSRRSRSGSSASRSRASTRGAFARPSSTPFPPTVTTPTHGTVHVNSGAMTCSPFSESPRRLPSGRRDPGQSHPPIDRARRARYSPTRSKAASWASPSHQGRGVDLRLLRTSFIPQWPSVKPNYEHQQRRPAVIVDLDTRRSRPRLPRHGRAARARRPTPASPSSHPSLFRVRPCAGRIGLAPPKDFIFPQPAHPAFGPRALARPTNTSSKPASPRPMASLVVAPTTLNSAVFIVLARPGRRHGPLMSKPWAASERDPPWGWCCAKWSTSKPQSAART